MKLILRSVFTFKSAMLFLLILGVSARIFFATYMPIWGSDEGWSYWLSGWYSAKPFSFIIYNPVDFAHPPGYYVLLSVLRVITDNLVILRFLSILAVLFSVLLLWKIGKKYHGEQYAQVLVVSYSLSGYFLITDWMVRGYALTTCLILASVYFDVHYLSPGKIDLSKLRYLFILYFVHVMGLYVDYSFWWYHFGFCCMALVNILQNKNRGDRLLFGYKLAALIMAFLSFLLIYPGFFQNILSARKGVEWAWFFVNPSIFLPYFLGSTNLPILTIVGLGSIILGGYLTVKRNNGRLFTVFISAIFAFVISMLTTFFYSPLFHVRNLLIVGLAILFLSAEVVYWLISRHYCYGLFVALVCFLNTFFLLKFDPKSLWINVYPWRYVVPRYSEEVNNYYLIDETAKIYFYNNRITPFTLWPLEYTLEGRDVLVGVKHKYVHGVPDLDMCVRVLDPLWQCRY